MISVPQNPQFGRVARKRYQAETARVLAALDRTVGAEVFNPIVKT